MFRWGMNKSWNKMVLKVQIQLLNKEYRYWCKKYGKDFVDASIGNELQLYADNLDEDVLEGHKEVYPDLLKGVKHKTNKR